MICVAVGTLLSTACSKHNDFPQPLGVSTPPVVSDFTADPGPNAADYDLSWTLANTSAIKGFRLYLLSDFAGSELLLEISDPFSTSVMINTGFPVTGAVFGLATVSTENVEGAMATVTAP